MPVAINGTTGAVTGLAQLPDSAMSAGSIIQVVHVTKTDISSISLGGSSAFYDVPSPTATITPSSSSNKILIDAILNISTDAGLHITAQILRGSTNIAFGDGSQSSVIEGYAHRYTRATNGHYSIDQMALCHEIRPAHISNYI